MRFEGSFGNWLRQRRKALDLTQQDLADQVSYSVVTIRKIERDITRPSKQMAERLAVVLAVSPDERPTFMSFARRVTDSRPGLRTDETLFTPVHNLPFQSTSFLGRENEMAQIAERLNDPTCRLLTLVGPGGIGKTRLALQATLGQAEEYADGVYFVSLAPVGSATLIAAAIASTVQLSFHGQEEPNIQVVNYLRGKNMLLVMDNYEHLLPEISLLTDLLANAPRLKMLATSRERLNLQEEWTLAVEGLPFPSMTFNGDTDVGSYSAVQLFVQRTRQVQAGFSLDEAVHAVVDICQAVEGMPLGIELAVTWLRAMPCQQIAGQIRRNLDFLATPLRDVPERHRSLRAVFEHSWGLLSEAERNALMKLSVFRGGIDPEAAEQVAGASLSMLAGLADKSLLRLNPSGRYELHELLRQFAADKLLEANKTTETQLCHFQYFLNLAEQLDRHYFGPQHVVWMDRLEIELDNFRAALDWAWQAGDTPSGLWLAGTLGWFWNRRDHWKEGIEWLKKFLISDRNSALQVRAKATHHALELSSELGDNEYAAALCEEVVRLAYEVEDQWLKAWLLTSLGYLGSCSGNPHPARLEEALTLFRKLGDQWGICESLARLAHLSYISGDFVRAGELREEGIQLARQAGDKSVLSWLLFGSALSNWREGGAHQRTESIFHECLALFRELGYKNGTAATLYNLGGFAQGRGEDEQARALFESSLRLVQQMGSKYFAVLSLLRLGDIFCRYGELHRGVRLLGVVGNLLPGINQNSGQMEVNGRLADYERGLAAARAELGEEAFAAAFAEGRAMTLEQAIAYALDHATDVEARSFA